MKKVIITLIILAAMVGQGFAQEKLKIGEVVDGKLKITNESYLRSFLMNNLEKSGILGKNILIEASPTADRFFAYTKVSANKNNVTNIGVLMFSMQDDVFIVAQPSYQTDGPGVGGSATYSCIGDPCENCNLVITWPSGSWKPDVSCNCQTAGGLCNMTVTITVNVKIGL